MANRCQWVRIGSTNVCDRPCRGKYCFSHTRRARDVKLCKICGRAIKYDCGLCMACGYNAKQMCNAREIEREFIRISGHIRKYGLLETCVVNGKKQYGGR
jgi:hypothetical protein